MGQSTVSEYLYRAKKKGISWPLPPEMDDQTLENLLFSNAFSRPENRTPPDFKWIHKELKRKGVTLQLLWEEYFESNPDGYQYSFFCKLYRKWAKKSGLWMIQQHKAGEKTFIDYAGLTIPIYNSDGTCFDAQIFVAVMGASNYAYAEATKSQKLEDWINSHIRMSQFFGGVTEAWIPDNLKSGVKSSHRYDPELNPTFREFAKYFEVAVIPTRVRTPKDKSKVEKGVQDIERQILARLRNRKFFSLKELNIEIRKLLDEFNRRPFQKIKGSRLSLFEEIDKPNLKPLPDTPYMFVEWKRTRVGQNYHVDVLGHYYSIPYQFVKEYVEVRIGEKTIEVFLKNKRVASHIRSNEIGGKTTEPSHQPLHHRAYAECTPENLLKKAKEIGENCEKWVEAVLQDDSMHIIQRKKNCSGVLRLTKHYSSERIEMVCAYCFNVEIFTCRRFESVLKNRIDQFTRPRTEKIIPLPQSHEYVRGAAYYN
jgi:transposase